MSRDAEGRDVSLLSAVEQARRIRAGDLTAVELLDACLARVDRHNAELNAVVTINPRVRDEADAVDRRVAAGQDPGPLAGLVVGIKDVTETAGLRTTFGSKLFENHVPEEDALVVRRFRDAGAVILGKTNTPEFAAGGNTWNDVFGVTRNPWDPSKSAGGSTGGGAAALATGMLSLAHGTDLGGSLRIPASFCGVVGLRPTPGLIPTVPSPDPTDVLSVTGTLARTPADIALSLAALSGPASGEGPGPPRWTGPVPDPETLFDRPVAYCPDLADLGIDRDVAAVCGEAVEALRGFGVKVDVVELDLSWAIDAFVTLRGQWFVSHFRDSLDRIDDYGVNVAANLRLGLAVTSAASEVALRCRDEVRARLQSLFESYGALLAPCMAIPPFPAEENYPREIAGRLMETYVDWMAPTFLLSLPGLPVACVPAGLDRAGLPVGLQVVAPPGGEASALAWAQVVQRGRPIGTPPLLTAG